MSARTDAWRGTSTLAHEAAPRYQSDLPDLWQPMPRQRPLSVVRVTGGLLYLWCEGARLAIVDAASGRVLRVTTKRVTALG